MTTTYLNGYRPATEKFSGRKLARADYSKSQRAAIAASVLCGEKPTTKQVARACGVSIAYVLKAKALTPVERAIMCGGFMEIADIPPSRAELKRTVTRAGVDRTWDILCNQL
jgi:hypothetical protein